MRTRELRANSTSNTLSSFPNIDHELDQIERELQQLHNHFVKKKGSKHCQLITQRMGVLKTHLQLEQAITKLQKFLSIDFLLLPQDRAIISWSKTFLNQTIRYFRSLHEFSCKQLWVQLFLNRLGYATDHSGGFISPRSGTILDPINDFSNDLMDLPTRYKNLKNTEKYLQEAIETGQMQIEQLTRDYHNYEIAKINRISSDTLNTRIGQNLSDAIKSPILRTIGQILLLEAIIIRRPDLYEELIEDLTKKEHQQKILLDLCRQHAELDLPNLSSEEMLSKKKAISERMKDELELLRQAEKKALSRLRDLTSPKTPSVHPIIVQKITKKVNTMIDEP
jgi:hypothetical protein